MMMCAYSDLYVDDAMTNLGELIYSGVKLFGMDKEELYRDFSYSNIGRCFSQGNPRFVTGMSGFELLEYLLFDTRRKEVRVPRIEDSSFMLTDEYNAGSALAYYQWKKNDSFRSLYNSGLTMEIALSVLPASNADLDRFTEKIDIIIERPNNHKAHTLARLRTYWDLSQRELSEKSGVSLRSIQLYEQGQNDISKASADVIYRLSKALGCSMENLIEKRG